MENVEENKEKWKMKGGQWGQMEKNVKGKEEIKKCKGKRDWKKLMTQDGTSLEQNAEARL